MSSFSFGSDPEFMLKKGSKYISAIDVVEGDIVNRIERSGHQFYWDNVLAECAIKPSFSKEEAVANFQEALKIYAEIVAPCKLTIQASQEYPKEALEDERARNAGCKFDTCAYLCKDMKDADSARDAIKNSSLRTCGGHIHLGQSEGVLDGAGPEPIIAVFLMDLFLGIPSLFISKDPTASRRRGIYGQAGRYRSKPYGFEYRSLDNFWLASPTLLELIYDVCNFVVERVEGNDWQGMWSFDEEMYWDMKSDGLDPGPSFMLRGFEPDYKFKIKKCIDESNKETAKEFLEWTQDIMAPSLFRRLEKAMNRKTPYNFYKEWSL